MGMKVCGTLSAFSSLIVMIIIARFKYLRKRCVYQIIFYISICDFFSAIGESVGQSQDGTFQCWFQAIVTNIFVLSSIFWTTTIALVLLVTLANHRYSINIYSLPHQLICWVLPIALTFAPLSTMTFGNLDRDHGWCFLDKNDESHSWTTVMWFIVSFYGWLWGSILLYVGLFLYVTVKYINSENSKLAAQTIKRLAWYPMIQLLCWVMSMVLDFSRLGNSNEKTVNNSLIFKFTQIFSCSQGFLSMIVFFFTNREVLSTKIPQFFVADNVSTTSESERIESEVDDFIESRISYITVESANLLGNVSFSSKFSAPLYQDTSIIARTTSRLQSVTRTFVNFFERSDTTNDQHVVFE
jgi:hypothetical protein